MKCTYPEYFIQLIEGILHTGKGCEARYHLCKDASNAPVEYNLSEFHCDTYKQKPQETLSELADSKSVQLILKELYPNSAADSSKGQHILSARQILAVTTDCNKVQHNLTNVSKF